MSKCSWITAVAFGLTLLSLPVGHAQESKENHGQGQTETQQSQPDDSSWAIPVEIIEDQAEAEARKSREERSEQRERDDLAAQEGMNEATQKMADYGLYQTILVGIGTLLLLYTLHLTRQANKAALTAANAAKRTVEETRLIGERQVRAYVHIDKIELQHVNDKFKPQIAITYKNFGQSPARRIDLQVFIMFDLGGGDIREIKDEDPKTGPNLGPSQYAITHLPIAFGFIEGMRGMVASGEIPVFVHGAINYTDMFDEQRYTKFNFKLHVDPVDGLTDTDMFLICKDGNDCT